MEKKYKISINSQTIILQSEEKYKEFKNQYNNYNFMISNQINEVIGTQRPIKAIKPKQSTIREEVASIREEVASIREEVASIREEVSLLKDLIMALDRKFETKIDTLIKVNNLKLA